MTTDATSSAQDHGSRSRRLLRNVLHLGFGQAVSTCLGFLLVAALGRTLEPSDFGLLYLVGTIYGFVGILIDWGQSTYVVRDAARARPDKAEFVGAALAVRVISNLCAVAAGAMIARLLGYDGLTVLLVALAALAGLPGSLAALFGLLFRGRDRMDLDVLIGLVGKALGTAVLVATLAVSRSLITIVAVSAVGGIGALILSLALKRRFAIAIKAPKAQLVRDLFWLGAPIAIMSLCLGMQSFVDVALLSVLTGPAVVGWLGASRTILGVFMAPASILASASFPDMSRAAASAPELRRILSSSSRIILAVGACAATILLVFAELCVSAAYGYGKLDQASVLLQVTSPILPLLFLNFVVANAVFAVGRTAAVAIAKVFCMAVGAIIGWFAVKYCQTQFQNGAIGVIVSFGVMEGVMLAILLSLLPDAAVDRQVLGHLIRAYGIFGAVLVAFSTLPSLPLWQSMPIYGVIFVAGLLMTRLVPIADIANRRL